MLSVFFFHLDDDDFLDNASDAVGQRNGSRSLVRQRSCQFKDENHYTVAKICCKRSNRNWEGAGEITAELEGRIHFTVQ